MHPDYKFENTVANGEFMLADCQSSVHPTHSGNEPGTRA